MNLKSYISFLHLPGILIPLLAWFIIPAITYGQETENVLVLGSRSVPDKKWQQNGVFYGYSPQQELLQYRTANSKTFQNPDGTNTILMVGPTHYKDDNGVLQDIKYTITPNNSNRNTEYKYCNTTNELKTYFPETPVKNGIRFNYAKFDFDFWRNPSMKFKVGDKLIASEKAKNTVANTLENKIFYTETYQGIKEEFEILENTKGVEHTIMLDKLPSLFPKEADATLEFTQFIPVKKGWKIFSDTIEKITNFTANSFYIEIGDEKIHFNPIIIFDNQIASKKLANEILNRLTERITEEQKVLLKNISKGSYFVEFVEGGIQLTYRIDGNWLNDKNRMFPVTIDPTVNISPDAITSSQISYLWNLFNVDTRVQSIILSSEITAAGLSNGDVITALGLYLIDNGCKLNHTGLKIRIKNTSSTSTTAFENSGYTTNCYSGSQNLVSTGWKTHTFSSNHTFNSSYNMLIDFTMNATIFSCTAHNGFNWRYSGTNSTYRAYSMLDAGDPQTWTSSSFGVYPDNEPYVPSLQITYTVSSCTAPSTQASNFTHSETATTINAGWTRGNGNNVLVVAKAGSAPTDPTNGTTYTANAAYGSGTACGGGYVVYKGSGTSVTVTGLTTGTTYYFALYEYNTTGTCYNLTQLTGTATPPTNSAPGVPSFYNTGGSEQLAFNNSYIFDDTPTFRVSATDNDGDNLEYRIEIADNAAFSSINWTRDFTNGGSYYTSGTTYNLTCTTLSGIVAGTTYYVRVKAKDPSGTNTYGTATSSTYSFTYKSSGNVDWFQTTDAQFNTGTHSSTATSSNSVINTSTGYLINNNLESSTGWTLGENVDDDNDCAWTWSSPAVGYYSSASHAYWINDADDNYRGWLIAPAVSIPSDASSCQVKFWHRMNTEDNYDGGYLQYRIDGGSWTKVTTFSSNGYTGNLGTSCPSGAQSGWEGVISACTVIADLPAGAYGHSIEYSFWYESDYASAPTGTIGWWIDDFQITGTIPVTFTSTDIEFASFFGASDWGKLQWNQTLNGGTITFKVQEYTGGTWVNVTGLTSISSTGDGAKEFDMSSYLSSSNTKIRVIATFTNGSSSPLLNEWKVTCAFKDVTSIATTPSVAVGAGCVNSTSTSSATATPVFSFRLQDKGTSDGVATKVTQIKIKKTSGTADLTNSIAGAELYLGASKITTGTVVITDDDITFPITSGNLNIANNTTSSDITMKVWLNTTNIIDNTTMVFKIDQTGHGFTTDASGSDFAADFGSAITGNTMTICITATKICFETNEPPTGVASSQVFPVSVYAGDANCNLDVDYSCNVTLTNTGSGTIQASGTPFLTSQALVNGAFSWNNVYNSTIGTFAIVANCGSISGTSSSITCAAAPESFSITAPLNSSGCAGNISVTWGASTGATSYSLYYCEGEDCIPTASTDYVSSVTSPRTFNASSSNTVYRFAIKAINAAGATWSSNIGTYTALNGFTWKGFKSTEWTNVENWCGGVAPTASNDVFIPDAANTSFDPTLSSASVKSITIMSGGILNGGSGTTFNVAGNWSNSGTFTPATSTIKFNGTSDQTCDNGSSAFYHYTIDKASGTLSLSENNLDVNGNLTITAGTFDAANYNINVAGNWSNSGTFDAGTGTVTFDGTTQAMNRVCTGYTTRVFSENWEAGSDGWTLTSKAGENEWRRQTGSAHNGSWDMAIYDLNAAAGTGGYKFYEVSGIGADEYYDCRKDIDLSDYSEARLSFWYRCDAGTSGDDARRGHVLMDNTYLLNYSTQRLWGASSYTQSIADGGGGTTSNISIPSSLLGNGEHSLIFRFFIGGSNLSGGGDPGFCIDDIILEGNLSKDEFYNVRFNSSTSMTLNCSFSAQDIEINTGILNANGKRVYCTGNFTNNGTYTAASNKILFNGESTQTIKGSSNTTFYDFEKNTAAELIIGDPVASGKTIEVANTFSWEDNNDEIQVGNGQVTTFKISNDNLLIQNGCTFTTADASTVSVGKNYYNYGTYDHTNSGEVTFETANNSVILKDPAVVIYSENFESGATPSGWSLGDGAAANDSHWKVCSGMGHNSTYDLAIYAEDYGIDHDYNWILGALTIYATKTIDLTQYNTATLEFWYRCGGETGRDYGSVIINDGTDNTVADNLCSKINWTKNPKIDLTPYCGKSIILKFKWQYDNNGAGSHPSISIDDIVITGISNNMETFHNLTINKTNAANTTRLQCPIDVNNNMLINKGNFITTGFSFPVGQNWTNANSNVTFTHMNNTITFDGNQEGKTQLINSGSLVLPFYNVVVNNTGGTSNIVSLSTNKLDVDNNLTLTAGTLDANVSGVQNIDVGGNWLNNGGLYEARTNTVTFNGSSNTQQLTSRGAAYNTFYNVTINNTGGSVELQDSLTMNNTMSLIKGYLNSNNKNIRLKGHWHVGNGTTYGTFNQGTGDTRVTFFGTSTQNANLNTDNSTVNLHDFFFNDVIIDGTDVRFNLDSDTYKILVKLLQINNNKYFKVVHK